MELELAWGRLRRWYLKRFRPGYVARMQSVRRGHCPNCPHAVIDPRDLKYFRGYCGFSFDPQDDPFRWRDHLPIARHGWAEVICYAGPLLLLGAWTVWWQPWAGFPCLAAGLATASFFRNPPRRAPAEPGLIVAPADGRVTDVTPVEELPVIGGSGIRIGIFLSVLDVHVNRCPEKATVEAVYYRPGRFWDARHPQAGEQNESTTVVLGASLVPGGAFVVRQIAGAIARRIVCHVVPGDRLERGQPMGLIKFGSRTELFLPAQEGIRIRVSTGTRVKAGVSVVAEYSRTVQE
jgi:phosphatidylserine decarboxylase